MKKKILPIGRQSFRKLQEDNGIYVDKTSLIYDLCNPGGLYFLSRPRRFGKSLLLSTLHELFVGSQELFTNTWIADKWDWTQKNPVIHISFLTVAYETDGLEVGLRECLLEQFEMYQLDSKGKQDIKLLFFDLIKQLAETQGKVVILIDEYDKPIIDYMEFHQIEQAKTNQATLAVFYSALKEADAYIRLLFITGVSKFAQVSLFSKLNNLSDLTFHPDYATLVGYTQTEFETNFDPYIQKALNTFSDYDRPTFLEKIRLWYDGYSWDGGTRLYNPYDILLFLDLREFKSYWFQTGTPTFLIKKMTEEVFFHVEDVEVDDVFLNQYSLDNIELTALMFQTGYLTVKEKGEDGAMILSYPNKEVRLAMYSFLINDMSNYKSAGGTTVRHLKQAFMQNDLERVENILVALFGGLTYDVYMHQNIQQVEGFYHGLVHILFKCLGLYIQSEVHTTKGRADSLVETPTHIYFLEFKINSTADIAFQQIVNKKYMTAYKADKRIKVGIGINFNTTSHELDDWKTEGL